MISKAEEIEFYKTIYILTFGKGFHYFHSNDSNTIFDFLKEQFWGEDLRLRINLLAKLLYFDSLTNPQISNELKVKSEELTQYANHIQE
ncbi:MAG: hypothetical protein E6772_17900 [Dysgonomonas sp.]|nr:hypothetical protein [Dysgonomonas sp.]